jgi:hypothetical protein
VFALKAQSATPRSGRKSSRAAPARSMTTTTRCSATATTSSTSRA